MQELKLTMDLIPKTSWYQSVYNSIPKNAWNKIREETIKKYNNRCAICLNEGRLSCHEIWEYDDIQHLQKLVGFIALCNLCHSVKHFGKTLLSSQEGKFDIEVVIKHFMKVNNCDEEVFEKHKNESFEKWRERSKYQWEINFGAYSPIIKNFKK